MKKDSELIEELRKKVRGLTGRNHYAAFLARAILNELNALSAEEMGKKFNNLVQCPVPVTNPGFRCFPVELDLTDLTYELELNAYSEWLKQGKAPLDYHEYRKTAYRSKGSLFVEKLISMAEDFSEHLKRISGQTAIPIRSLIEIVVIMTQEKACLASGQGQSQSIFRNCTVSVPGEAGEPEQLLLNISRRLEDLFLEAFLVLMIAGLADYINTIEVFMRFNNYDNIKKHLLEKACFLEMERRIHQINTYEDLDNYIESELDFFGTFFPQFAKFCLKHVRFIAGKRVRLTETAVGIQQDPFALYNADDEEEDNEED